MTCAWIFLLMGLMSLVGSVIFLVSWWQIRGGPIPEGYHGDAVAGDLLVQIEDVTEPNEEV